MIRTFVAIGICVLGLATPGFAEPVYIEAGTLLVKAGEAPLTDHTLVVDDGRVVDVQAGFMAPDGADVVDLRDSFVMAGLFDMHVHLQGEIGPQNDREMLKMSFEEVGMRSVMFARRTLMAGFTTVRDLGSLSGQHMYALKKAVDEGWVDGHRIIEGAGVNVTGSHGDVDGVRHEFLAPLSPPTLCNGPYECRAMVREAVKYGADVIKITATGGVLSDTDTGTALQMAMDEMREIVETAHRLGRRVAAHAHEAEGVNAALEAGVDSIEHGSYADDRSVELFKSGDHYLVPTLLAGDTVVRFAKAGGLGSDDIREKALRVGSDMMAAFRRAVDGGVPIAYGTDSGVSKHGDNGREAALMVSGGMTPMAVLEAATVNAARLADMEAELGTLEAGRIADVIAMETSPLDDITSLERVSFVMKEGRVIKDR